MDAMYVVIFAIIALVIGLALGALLMRLRQQSALFQARREAEQTMAAAEQAQQQALHERDVELIRLQESVDHLQSNTAQQADELSASAEVIARERAQYRNSPRPMPGRAIAQGQRTASPAAAGAIG